MKKIKVLLTVVVSLFIILLSSCFSSTYWEEWEGPIKGYVSLDENDQITGFNLGKNPGQKKYDANIYIHSYDKRPTVKITRQYYNPSSTYYDIENGYWVYKFRENEYFEVVTGLYCYCDNQDAYIINNICRTGDTEHLNSGTHADYRFLIEVTGMRDKIIYMDNEH